MTTRSLAALPEPLARLVDAGLVDVVDVPELSASDVAGIVHEYCGDRVSHDSLEAVLARAGGNPLALRLIVEAAVAGGKAVTGPSGLEFEVTVPARLHRLAREWLDALSPDAREVVEILAVSGEVQAEVLDSPGAVHELATAALIVVTDRGTVHLAHRLYAELISEQLTAATLDARRVAAAALLAQSDEPRARFRRFAILSRSSLPPSSGELAWAAEYAYAHNDHREAIHLGEFAKVRAADLGEGLPAAAMGSRAAALSALGRLDEADDAFREALAAASDDGSLGLIASHAGTHWAVRRLRPAIAVEVVSGTLDRVVDDAARRYLTADLGKWVLWDQSPGELLDAREDDDPQVAQNIFMLRLHAAIFNGHFAIATDAIARARGLAVQHPEAMRNADELARFGSCLVAFFRGRHEQARELLTAGRAQYLGDGYGMWGYGAGLMALHAGDYEYALAVSDEASDLLRWRDFVGALGPSIAVAATAAARLGRHDIARARLESIDPVERLHVTTAVQAAEAEAWMLAADGLAAQASAQLAEAARTAIAASCCTFAGLAAYTGVRIGAPEPVIDVLHTVAAQVPDGALFSTMVRHAESLLAGDARELYAVAEQLAGIGLRAGAADAARQAADAALATNAVALRRRAVTLATQLVRGNELPEPEALGLTDRELTIAKAAAARQRNREIAEELGLSVRTVENHLASAFRKLEVTSRDELRERLRV